MNPLSGTADAAGHDAPDVDGLRAPGPSKADSGGDSRKVLVVGRWERLPRPPLWSAVLVSLWVALIIAFTLITRAHDISASVCLLKTASGGVPCPTCGGTRTVFFTLDGRIGAALLQNPLVFIGLGAASSWLAVTYLFRLRVALQLSRRGKHVMLGAVAILFLINWAYVIAIDGPWDNSVKATVSEAQERGIHRFFGE